ncbi:hypothetical protein Vafri_509 [Volvox africanus]|nr:hypothetical protein Vafri_509 [Volvox africanus]
MPVLPAVGSRLLPLPPLLPLPLPAPSPILASKLYSPPPPTLFWICHFGVITAVDVKNEEAPTPLVLPPLLCRRCVTCDGPAASAAAAAAAAASSRALLCIKSS